MLFVTGGLQYLADFQFDERYRSGKVNDDAHTLSRLPMDIDSYFHVQKSCLETPSWQRGKAVELQGKKMWLMLH